MPTVDSQFWIQSLNSYGFVLFCIICFLCAHTMTSPHCIQWHEFVKISLYHFIYFLFVCAQTNQLCDHQMLCLSDRLCNGYIYFIWKYVDFLDANPLYLSCLLYALHLLHGNTLHDSLREQLLTGWLAKKHIGLDFFGAGGSFNTRRWINVYKQIDYEFINIWS